MYLFSFRKSFLRKKLKQMKIPEKNKYKQFQTKDKLKQSKAYTDKYNPLISRQKVKQK